MSGFGGRFRARHRHRSLHALRDEDRERRDSHINAGAIQGRQISITILNTDNRPCIGALACDISPEREKTALPKRSLPVFLLRLMRGNMLRTG